MKFDPGILRPYDIRGKYGEDFDDEFAMRLGAALVHKFSAKQMIVARDMRPSAIPLVKAVIEGITAAGCDVTDIGESSTPFFYYAVINGKAPVGVMITASHMGPEFNGFKICKKDAMVLGKESGLVELGEMVRILPPPTASRTGRTKTADYVAEHAKALIHFAQVKKGEIQLKIAYDADAMIGVELEAIFKELGITTVKEGWDIKFGFDTDGDRLMIYNADGKQIRADLFAGVIAADLAHHKHFFVHLSGGPKVIADLRASRGVTDYLKDQKIVLVPSKIGHTNIKAMMKKEKVDFAGEASGHMMFKEIMYSESTQLALLKLLKIMTVENKTIDELIKPMDTWSYSGEINTPIAGWPDSVAPIVAKLKEKYADGKIDELDGLRVDYPDWWFLIRASGTEPVVRLIVEAHTKEAMDAKIAELQALITNPS